MPLLDHFHPPLSDERSWEGIHGAWPGMIVQQLNEVLPPQFFAEPRIHWGSVVEVDVATIESVEPHPPGGIATAVWAPPRPAILLDVEGLDPHSIEVRVFQRRGGLRLVAAVELVSPGNKDRSDSRRAFVAKCIGYLQAGIGLAVVDVVTERRANLHAELLQALGGSVVATENGNGTVDAARDKPIYSAGYRSVPRGESAARLEVWPEPLQVGEPLPTLPLWIGLNQCVPLELEASYMAACRVLRIDVD